MVMASTRKASHSAHLVGHFATCSAGVLAHISLPGTQQLRACNILQHALVACCDWAPDNDSVMSSVGGVLHCKLEYHSCACRSRKLVDRLAKGSIYTTSDTSNG